MTVDRIDRWTFYRCPECSWARSSGGGRCRNAFAHAPDERVMLEAVEVVPASQLEGAVKTLRYEYAHTLDDATKWRVGETLRAMGVPVSSEGGQ
jgi:hypothetical protein